MEVKILNLSMYSKIIAASFFICFFLAFLFIPRLRKRHIGQMVRKEGPKSHLSKRGTPTMGGVFIVVALLLTLLFFRSINSTITIILIATFGFGGIGFLDDYIKIVKKRSLGLDERQKLILQFIISVILIFTYESLFERSIIYQKIPFIKEEVNLSYLMYPIQIFIITGTVNATNLTDGLDGLLTGVSIPVFLCLGIIGLSDNLNVTIFSSAMLGSLLGFLVFNSNPASIFMGDLGSMAIGGALASICLILRMNFYLPILAGISMFEVISVIIQAISYKTRKGKRVFLMSPIHHHFELKGYKKQKIVTTFTVISSFLSVLSLIIYLK